MQLTNHCSFICHGFLMCIIFLLHPWCATLPGSTVTGVLCVCSFCCIIRPWVFILGVLSLLLHPSVDSCMVHSICSVIRPGESLMYQDWKTFYLKNIPFKSFSTNHVGNKQRTIDIAASSSVDPWCAPFAVASIGVLCIAASSFNGSFVYYEQNIQSLLITLGADPEIVQGALINAYRVYT